MSHGGMSHTQMRVFLALLTRGAYVMSHTQRSHVTHRNESCHTGECQTRNCVAFFALLTRAAHPASTVTQLLQHTHCNTHTATHTLQHAHCTAMHRNAYCNTQAQRRQLAPHTLPIS